MVFQESQKFFNLSPINGDITKNEQKVKFRSKNWKLQYHLFGRGG